MDIYERLRKRKISESNKKIIEQFIKNRKSEGIRERRLSKYEYILSVFAGVVKKDISKVGEEDLRKFSIWLLEQKLSENTKITFKIVLKTFFRNFVFNGELPKKFKEILKAKRITNNLTPQDLWSMEDIQKLLDQTQNIRRKAMIMVLFEGGLRAGELLSLRVGDIEFTDWGCRIFIPKSKTKTRSLPLFNAAPLLSLYLKTHPKREDKGSPLWLNDKGEPMKYPALRKMLNELKKKAGFQNRRIYPHLIRHSRLTILSQQLKSAELKEFAGWSSIKMVDTYSHLNCENVEEKLLEQQGIKVESRKKIYNLVKCQRCGQLNEYGAKYCSFCGLALSSEVIKDLELIKEGDNLLATILKKLVENEATKKAIFNILIEELRKNPELKNLEKLAN